MSGIDGMEELVAEFVVECRELLEDVEAKLIELERSRSRSGTPSRATLDAVFRAFHTMKGTAGFLGFANLVAVAHDAESLLDDLRQNRTELVAPHVTALCDAVDFCREALNQVSSDGHDQALSGRAGDLVENLRRAREAKPAKGAKKAAAKPASDASEAPSASEAPAAAPPAPAAATAAPDRASPITIDLGDPTPEADAAPAVGSTADDALASDEAPTFPEAAAAWAGEPQVAAAAAPARKDDEPNEEAESAEAESAEAESAGDATAANGNAAAPGGERKSEEGGARKTIRVDVEKLDALINLVGELILAENMVAHDEALAGLQIDSFQKAVMHLNRVTRGLHDIAMAVRMVAIEGLFRKMHRVVRDLSMRLGKDVELEVEGEGTEIDKNLVEHIGDPLMHIMRNALDHGIESPEARIAAGKPPVGTIRLEARHHGGEVWISVTDDGRGLDREKILAKAIARGLVDPDQAQSWPDARVFGLVFQPGFSTAEVVTEVSGRGVGMDVVMRNIQWLKGKVDIASTPGHGATFTLRIPLTLAIIEGMLVDIAGSRYIVPMLAIRELIQLRPGILHILPDGREVARVRNQFIGLVRLSDLHHLGARRRSDDGILVIVEHDGVQVALLVDALLGQRQTVIKPLPDYFGELPGISGCSILSNGDITLILELAALVRGTGSSGHGMSATHYAA